MKKPLKIKTKLSFETTKKESKEKLDLIKKENYHPRSYRWRKYDLELIEDLVERVNDVGEYKIDRVKILRGAIFLAHKKDPKAFLKCVLEAEKNSMLSKL